MFPRVRLVNCRCTAGNYHRKLSGFPVVALLPVVSACCQARMSFFLHHVATNYILKKSPLLLSQLSWQASFLAACQKRSNQIWNRNMRLCLVFSSSFISTKWHKCTLQEKLFTINALGLVQEHSIPGPGDLSTEITSVRDKRGEMDRFNVVPNV